MRAHGIMFHHFHGGSHRRSQGAVGADDLEQLIAFVGRERILPAEEFFSRAVRGGLRAEHVCLTFDDNLRCQFDVARPVLEKYGLTAFWFIATATLNGQGAEFEIHRSFRERCFHGIDDFHEAFFRAVCSGEHCPKVEQALRSFDPRTFLATFPFYTDADRRFRFVRDEVLGPSAYDETMRSMMGESGVRPGDLTRDLWMDEDCLVALHRGGHILGLHTHTHPTRVAYLSAAEQEREYRDNYMALMQLTGRTPQTASHPCNSYNAATLAILRKLGIRLGFRADGALADAGPLEHPREDVACILRRMAECESPSSPAISLGTSR
ncbi:MAG: polysaccharide deacetylase family protein [Planctomycetes bacterium]|nr:polysaccharide deacetylase family protein [Planctomycetota bacterium]